MNILVVKMSSVGDVVHALPVAAALKSHYRSCRISWVVEPAAASLLQNHHYVDDVIVFEKNKKRNLLYMSDFIKRLRTVKYDLCIDLQGLFKSAAVVFFARADRKIGWYNLREGSWLTSRRTSGPCRKEHVVERYLDVSRWLGCEMPVGKAGFGIGFSELEQETAQNISRAAGLAPGARYAVIAPGSVWRTKRWPPENFALLAAMLAERGVVPVIAGSGGERRLAELIVEEIARLSPENSGCAVNIAGQTSLKQLAFIISQAAVFAGNDSGPAHIAAAFAVPSLVFFGPSQPGRTGPYGDKNIILQTGCEKKQCMKRECPLGRNCMADISAGQALQAVCRLLDMKVNNA